MARLVGVVGAAGRRWAAAMVVTMAATVLLLWNLALGQMMAHGLAMNDFGRFYCSAVDFLAGAPMYGPTPATAMMIAGRPLQLWNLNPPHAHLLVLPLALLSPRAALALWALVSVICAGLAMRLALTECGLVLTARQRGLALVGLLAFAATGAIVATGQLAWLLMLPMTLAWRAARRSRWMVAAAWLGLAMSVKLFLILFLAYLVRRGQRRAALVAACTAAGCFATGVAVFGVAAHVDWLRALGSVTWQWAAMNASVSGFVTRLFGDCPYFTAAAPLPGVVRPLSLGLGAVIAALTLVAIGRSSGRAAVNHDFVLLLLGALLVSPLGWVYYWWLALPPMIAVVVGWGTSPCRPRSARLAAVGAPALVWPFPAVTLLQPSVLATATIGSVYFWATLLLWSAVLLEERAGGGGTGGGQA